MTKQKKYDENAKQFSIVFNGENKEILETLAAETGSKYGPLLNNMVSAFCNMSPALKETVQAAILNRMKYLSSIIENCPNDLFHVRECEESLIECQNVLTFINGEKVILSKEECLYRKVPIKDGTLIIPQKWEILNPEENTRRYAGVICININESIIFPFYMNKESVENLKDSEKKQIKDFCVNKLSNQDIDVKETNFYDIIDDANPKFNNNPPYGAYIKRN